MRKDYLTIEQRQEYLKELNKEQIQTIEEYKRLRFNSQVLTKVNQRGSEWQLQRELIYQDFDRHHPLSSPYVCNCGKHVKYLYVCKSASSGVIKNFGVKHLEDEAGIPKKIIMQVNQLHHRIDRGLDIILTFYHKGKRFPIKNYLLARKNLWLNAKNFNRNRLRYMIAFSKVNLPLYPDEENKLKALAEIYYNQQKLVQIIAQKKIKHRQLKKQKWQEKIREKQKLKEERLRQKEKQRKERLRVANLLQNLSSETILQNKILKLPAPIINSTSIISNKMLEEFTGSAGFQRLKEKMRLCFAKVIRFHVRDVDKYNLNVQDLSQRLAVYCIFNLGNFKRGKLINNYQQAAQVADKLLKNNSELRNTIDTFKTNQPEKIMERQIIRCYKILYAQIGVIGKNSEGHPIALNQIE